MRRHDRQGACVDTSLIKLAECLVPFGHRQRIYGGDKMLVAVVIAFAQPMFQCRGDAVVLKCLDLSEGMAFDPVGIVAKSRRFRTAVSPRH